MDNGTIRMVAVTDLSFDRKNPRLVEFASATTTTDFEIIRVLWETMDVRELVLSISANGFFRHETLYVAVEDGRSVVIEGNRRLAAVRVMMDPTLLPNATRAAMPEVEQGVTACLAELPTITTTRQDAWRYIGFKHVNGPARWSGFAKSHYIAQVHRDYGVPLADIAKQIGDTHSTVLRLYRGFVVLEQAETAAVFDRDERMRNHFSFSHLYTGLGYSGICGFRDIDPRPNDESTPVPPDHGRSPTIKAPRTPPAPTRERPGPAR